MTSARRRCVPVGATEVAEVATVADVAVPVATGAVAAAVVADGDHPPDGHPIAG